MRFYFLLNLSFLALPQGPYQRSVRACLVTSLTHGSAVAKVKGRDFPTLESLLIPSPRIRENLRVQKVLAMYAYD
jgi:hypothetical protein